MDTLNLEYFSKLFKGGAKGSKTTVELKSLSCENVLYYAKKKTFDLTKTRQVKGTNASGKTSIVKILFHCVLGPKTKSKMFLNDVAKSGSITVWYSVLGKSFQVHRTMVPGKTDVVVVTCLDDGTVKNTAETISSHGWQTFFQLNVLDSGLFTGMTAFKFKAFLHTCTGTEYLKKGFKELAEYLNALEIRLDEKKKTLEMIEFKESGPKSLPDLKKRQEKLQVLLNSYKKSVTRLENILFLEESERVPVTEKEFKQLLMSKSSRVFEKRFLYLFYKPLNLSAESKEKVQKDLERHLKCRKNLEQELENTQDTVSRAENLDTSRVFTKKERDALAQEVKQVEEKIQKTELLLSAKNSVNSEALETLKTSLNKDLEPFQVSISESCEILFQDRLVKLASHYEQNLTEILLRIYLSKHALHKFNFMFVDEFFDAFNKDKRKLVDTLTESLEETFKVVYYISHHWNF